VFPLFWEKQFFACGWPAGELPFFWVALPPRRHRPPSRRTVPAPHRRAMTPPKALDDGPSDAALPRSGGFPAVNLAKRAFACDAVAVAKGAAAGSSCRRRRRSF